MTPIRPDPNKESAAQQKLDLNREFAAIKVSNGGKLTLDEELALKNSLLKERDSPIRKRASSSLLQGADSSAYSALKDRNCASSCPFKYSDSSIEPVTTPSIFQRISSEQRPNSRTLHIPSRRFPVFSVRDTIRWERGRIASIRPTSEFVSDEEIMHRHSMLHFFENSDILAVSTQGLHILQQQGQRSCIPACVAMLILDRMPPASFYSPNELPLFEELGCNLATEMDAVQWFRDYNFTAFKEKVPMDGTAEFLAACLKRYGPGLLTIDHPLIKGHAIVLDAISIRRNRVSFRDPFHGWKIQISLTLLLSWLTRSQCFFIGCKYNSSST